MEADISEIKFLVKWHWVKASGKWMRVIDPAMESDKDFEKSMKIHFGEKLEEIGGKVSEP